MKIPHATALAPAGPVPIFATGLDFILQFKKTNLPVPIPL